MLTKSAPIDCTIKINPSPFLTRLIFSIFVLATLSLLILLPQYPWSGGCFPVLGIMGYRTLKTQPTITQCQQVSTGVWRLTDMEGAFLARNAQKAYRSRWIIILYLKRIPEGKPLTVIIPYDAVAPHCYNTLLFLSM